MLKALNNKIKILDNLLADQIAAGEVVERPSSVVKELIENSLDAGASEISISVLNGGKSLIEVKDDGIGMSYEDLLLCVKRFATSKVFTSDDILKVSTYGFRGEALPSISSVSSLTIVSRQENQEHGFQLNVEAGKEPEVTKRASPKGTSVKIENLFFNVPARKKFLKTDKSESNSVRSLVYDFSMARADVRFHLFIDGKEVFHARSGETLKLRTLATNLLSEDSSEIDFLKSYRNSDCVDSNSSLKKEIRITGFISQPLFSPKISSKFRTVINGRIVKSPLIFRAVRDAYGNYLKPGFYPAGVILLDIPSEDVDVNVHPQKAEVRFRYEPLVFSAVKEAAISALANTSNALISDKVYRINLPKEISNKISSETQSEILFIGEGALINESVNNSYSSSLSSLNLAASAFISSGEKSTEGELVANSSDFNKPEIEQNLNNKLRFLGQIFKLYLLFEGKDNFAIMDMHAAHERLTFYRLKKSFLSKKFSIQELLIPFRMPLASLNETDNIEAKLNTLSRFGIEAELRDDEIIVRSLPDVLNLERLEDIMLEVISSLPEDVLDSKINDSIDAYLSRLACHASIRSGDIIASEQAYALLDELTEAESSGWCPHGRPVIWWLSRYELDKKFGRV